MLIYQYVRPGQPLDRFTATPRLFFYFLSFFCFLLFELSVVTRMNDRSNQQWKPHTKEIISEPTKKKRSQMKLVKCVNGTSDVYKLWLVWFVSVEMVYVCATAPASVRWIGACIWVFRFLFWKNSDAQKWRRLVWMREEEGDDGENIVGNGDSSCLRLKKWMKNKQDIKRAYNRR